MVDTGRRLTRSHAVWAWSALLTAIVLAPLASRGFVLTYDMRWVPHLDLSRPEIWGLGSELPRAVPSDAVVALLQAVLPAEVVQRLALAVPLLLAGAGIARLVPRLPTPATLVAVTAYVWNPFVAERLVIGHWPLLIGYAALPWLIDAVRSERSRRAATVLALAACAMTPAGGLIGLVAGALASRSTRRRVEVALLALVVNAPWIVAGLLRAGDTASDPAGVAAFGLGSDGPLGPIGSALTLGGIWNGQVVPGSRTVWTSVVLAVVLWALLAVGVRAAGRDRAGLVVLAAVGIGVPVLGWLFPDLVRVLVSDVPGAGLLRDTTRILALAAPLWAVGLAHGAQSVRERIGGVAPAVVLVAVPLLAVPDLAWGAAGRLQPVEYPAEWSTVRSAISTSDVTGDVLVLPFDAYRAPEWNDRRPIVDPAGRWFDRPTVVSDDLVVGGVRIAGEDPRAREVQAVLDAGGDIDELRRLGLGLVVIDRSAPGADDLPSAIADRQPVVAEGDLALVELGAATSPSVPTGQVVAMVLAWVLAGASVLGALAVPLLRRVRAGGGGTRAAAGAADPT